MYGLYTGEYVRLSPPEAVILSANLGEGALN